MSEITIKNIAVICECSDGSIRQILINKGDTEVITAFLSQLSGGIKVLEKPLEGITLTPINHD